MNGFLNINKPSGMSSSQVVSRVRYKLGKKLKVGHMGTLDPMASGVLPIGVGRGTRLFEFLLKKKKTYIATFEFGYQTDTLDATGKILIEGQKIPTKQEILQALPNFLGKISQLPPQFSAKSVNGQRAYAVARAGGNVDLAPCEVVIHEFKLIKEIDKSKFQFEITCDAGTYIRSLCRDLASSLNTNATMTELQRTKSGQFNLEQSIEIDDVDETKLLPLDFVLQDLEKIEISKDDFKLLLDGKQVKTETNDGQYKIFCDNELQAIGRVENNIIEPKTWLR